MQIAGHAIPPSAAAGLSRAIDGFFALSPAQKAKWSPPSVGINRGYSGPKSERLSYSLGVMTAADLFEAFNVGTQASSHPGLSLDPVQYAENLWPDSPADFRGDVEAWFAHAGTLARDLTRIFELALDLPDGYFDGFQDHSLDVLRLNHYALPPGTAMPEVGQMGMGAHTDYGIVTVLWADRVTPGLQILDGEGRWHDVVPAPGALLVNLGDLLARWTNDRWISTMHRVLPPVDASGRVVRRRSAAYFHDGNADGLIACLPGCSDRDHPPLYPPVTVSQHLAEKLGGSRALQLNPHAAREASRLRAPDTAA